MDIHGNLALKGGASIQDAKLFAESEWPADPQPGTLIFKDSAIFACVKIASGLPVWVPMTQFIEMLTYTQPASSLEWVINHDLQTSRCIVQVYDADGKFVIPNEISQILNRVTVKFSVPTSGSAILLRGNTEGSAQDTLQYEQSFDNLATWTVTHGLGFNPIVSCIIGGNVVQPSSITYPTVNTAIVTFSVPRTGSVRCI